MPRSDRVTTLAAVGILSIVLCGLFWQAIFTDRVMSQADFLLTKAPWSAAAPEGAPYVAQNALLRDQSYQFIPWRRFTVDTLRRGVLPLWNPYHYCGAPFVANDQSAVFYPLSLLFLVLPFHTATLLSAILRLLVAGSGMFVLLRRLRVTFGPAVVSSLAFMLCGSQIVWLNHPHTNVTTLLPWLLLLVDRSFEPRGARNAALLALVVGVQFLGGHIESSLILALAAGSFLAVRMAMHVRASGGWRPLRRPLGYTVAAVLLGLCIGAVQWLPLAEYLNNSRVVAQRGTAAAVERETARGIWWRALPALAMPRLYGDPVDSAVTLPSVFRAELGLSNFNARNGAYVSVPMLLLGLIGITLVRRRPFAAYFSGLGILAACVAYRVQPIHSLFVMLPGMKLTAVMLTRMQLLVAFALCVLGAFALQRQLEDAPTVRSRSGLVVLLVALLGSAVACAWFVWFYLSDRPAFERTWQLLREPRLLPTDTAERVALGFAVSGVVLLVSALLTAGLVWRGSRPFGERAWIAWAILVVSDLFVFAYGYNPIVPSRYVFPETPGIEFLRENLGSGRIYTQGAFTGSTATWYGFRDIGGYDAIEVHDYAWLVRSRYGLPPGLLRALGVRYLVTAPSVGPAPGRRVHSGDVEIVEFPESISRVNVVGRARDVASLPPGEVLALLRDPDFDPTATVLLDTGGEAGKPGGKGLARITHDGVNEVIVDARSPDGGWLVLSDTYFPGWRVEVDGRPAELLRANFVFRAVRLAPGSHSVRFYYRPRSFLIGAWLSLFGLLGVGALALIPRFAPGPGSARPRPRPGGGRPRSSACRRG